MESNFSPVDAMYTTLYLDFQKKYYRNTISYWQGRCSLPVEELEDIISESAMSLLLQAREEDDATHILNCNYLKGIIRFKVLDRIRKQFITNKNDEMLDDEEAVKCHTSRFVSLDDCIAADDEDGTTFQRASQWEYDAYIEEIRESSMSAWRKRIRRRLLELFFSLDAKHQKLFRYHYGIGCKKLQFDEIAPLVGLKNGDVAKQVFCRKKLQLKEIVKSEKDALCRECPPSFQYTLRMVS